MERFKGVLWLFKDNETKLDITIMPEASAYLKMLTLRPNPNLAEFAFLGLGKDELIDTILTADEKHFRTGPGVKDLGNGIKYSKINPYEFENLFHKLEKTKRVHDLMVIGHFHPLLTPTDLTENQLRLSWGDVKAITGIVEYIPELLILYSGIAANTRRGPLLRIYKNSDIVYVKSFADIAKLPKITIKL